MTWIDIVPRRGARPAPTPPVTVAWHVRNAKTATAGSGQVAPSAPKMNIAISAPVTEALGWQAKQTVAIQRSADGQQLRIAAAPADRARTFSLHGVKDCRALTLSFAFPHIGDLQESQKAEGVNHSIEGYALILTLPGWACRLAQADTPPAPQQQRQAQPRAPAKPPATPRATTAAPAAPAQKLPPDPCLDGILPEDLAEARRMMKAPRVGARDLASYFGWPHPQALRIASMIRDEQAAAIFERGKAA